jgi:murein DD-endopeptidase MepM/ murein hydrolase activator NlpD
MRLPAQGFIAQGFSVAHPAVDIANTVGTPVLAPVGGTITIAGDLGECGLAVQIGDITNGHRLCHNSKLLVSVGQTVGEGQQVAEMGYTGKTIPDDVPEGSHVHWVTWKDGVRVDGRNYVIRGGNMYEGKTAEEWAAIAKDALPFKAAIIKAGKGEFWSKDLAEDKSQLEPGVDDLWRNKKDRQNDAPAIVNKQSVLDYISKHLQ